MTRGRLQRLQWHEIEGKEAAQQAGEVNAGSAMQPREGRVTADNDAENDELDRLLYTPKERRALQQEIELLNGTKMRCSLALSEYELLCDLYDRAPRLLQALVALVIEHKPADSIHPDILAELGDIHCLRPDGAVRPALASVLEVAYQPEAPDRLPLRYPIRHASPEQAGQISAISARGDARLLRYLRDMNDPPEEDLSR